MPDYESLLNRWQSAGLLDPDTVSRIRTWESTQAPVQGPVLAPKSENQAAAGIAWQGKVALILGGILLASGIILFVSAHWDQLGPGMRFLLVTAMVAVFHIGGALVREKYLATSTALHAVGTISTGAGIALVGQIFNIQEHWPAAILMWTAAAFLGWVLLRDQAQQTITLLLFPSWLICEWNFAADNRIGSDVYLGRFLFVWAVLYLTLFIGTERRVVRGILFATSSIAAAVAVFLLLESWRSWSGMEPFAPLHTRVWGWIIIAAIPLLFSLLKLRKSTIPVLAAIAFVIGLPWCMSVFVQSYHFGNNYSSYTRTEPNLVAHALVGAFCVFLMWWGVREASRGLVNLGIVAFGATVAWFYFSDLFDKMGRSLGLIGLGFLFLAGGWGLEKTRRRLLAHMTSTPVPVEQTQ
jgi:uncharacterized membrane protein